MQRQTQTATYWQELTIEEEDLEHLYELILEEERPRTSEDLALALIEMRCRREEDRIRGELERGTLYQPKESYEVGEKLVFPAFNYALGTVVGVRPGHNPRYGDFKVIQVRFEGEEGTREFASELAHPHKLNREKEELLAEALVPPDQLYAQYGQVVREKLVESLRANDEFVSFGDEWLLRGLLAEVHVGHLNIAEAVLDVSGKPLPPEEILKELDLPARPKEALVFSLNYALAQDERFDEVGTEEQVLWFLRRLEPLQALECPMHLRYQPLPYDRASLDEELLALEGELDDEAAEVQAPPEELDSVTIVLTYPHRRAGTIPLTPRTRSFFPRGRAERTMVTLIDGRTGSPMPGWVVHRHNYVCGLDRWYEEHDLPAGAYIKLERTDDPLAVVVDYLPRRQKSEWVRVAMAVGGRLTFEMRKRIIACEYDELMIVGEEDRAQLDALWLETEREQKPIFEVMCQVFPELAKLNPQGTVHAKTLYSAVNVIKRSPPGPIFAELASRACFVPMGNGYWVYDRRAR